MNVLMISPGFPDEMPMFTRALAQVGAGVFGVGDQHPQMMEESVRAALTDYLQVPDLWAEDEVVERVRAWLRGRELQRIECLWEPGMMLAAHLRETFGVEGMGREQSRWFRDKDSMKQVLDEAGLRTPRHARARTTVEVRDAAEEIGLPLIIKPISGAGSADTYPIFEQEDLDDALACLGHIEEVSVEEYIDGEEYTFDTVCAGGDILFQNVAWYRPKPLVARLNPWMAGQAICLRELEAPEIKVGVELGHSVLKALSFQTGFTHMEWFRTPSGEAVFGEIAARPPGGRLVHVMNFAHECDLFVGWAEAVCAGRISQTRDKRYNAGIVFKRAQGDGHIQRYEGLDHLLGEYGEFVAAIELNEVGNPKRDYRKVISGDGWIVVRHADLEKTVHMADRFSSELVVHAG